MAWKFWGKKKQAPVDEGPKEVNDYTGEQVVPTEQLVQMSDTPLPVPEKVLQLIRKEYLEDPEGLQQAEAKLAEIKMRAVDETHGNVVQIDGKIFSIMHADTHSRDVYQGIKQYDHLTYAKAAHRNINGEYEKPYTLLRLLEKSGRKIFPNIVQAEEFIDQYIPGKTVASRVQNWCLLLGLPKGGYCNPYGFWTNLRTLGYAWISPPTESMAGSVYYSDTEGGFFFHYLDLALPIICFRDVDGPERQVMEYDYVSNVHDGAGQHVDQTTGEQLSDEDAYQQWMQQGNNQQQQ